MNILLLAYGSRGDVQPMLAFAQGLQAAGYAVTLAAGSNFRTWIEGAGLRYAAFSTDMQALMGSESGKLWIETSSRNPIKGLGHMRDMMNQFGARINADMREMSADADVIVSGLPTFGMAAAIAEERDIPHLRIMFVPMKPSRDPRLTILPWWRGPSFLNRWSSKLSLRFMWNVNAEMVNQMRQQLGLAAWTRGDYLAAWQATPTLYGLSPAVVPHDPEWSGQNAVTGYWFYDDFGDWQPSDALCEFLAAGSKPVYVGFGSMSSSDPDGTLQTVVTALQRSEQRGIVYSGWADLHSDDLPESIFLLDGAPHHWLFPQMAAVVHHGGAGTTAAALRAGVPATIVAHMADQPYWGRRVVELGVAPTAIPRHKLNTQNLATAITAMVNEPAYSAQAAQLAQKIRAEDGVGEAVMAFSRMIQQ